MQKIKFLLGRYKRFTQRTYPEGPERDGAGLQQSRSSSTTSNLVWLGLKSHRIKQHKSFWIKSVAISSYTGAIEVNYIRIQPMMRSKLRIKQLWTKFIEIMRRKIRNTLVFVLNARYGCFQITDSKNRLCEEMKRERQTDGRKFWAVGVGWRTMGFIWWLGEWVVPSCLADFFLLFSLLTPHSKN